MSRFKQYIDTRNSAIEQCKTGGDPLKAIALAILAHAEANLATENDEVTVKFGDALTTDH